ncbi:anthranilate synthase alpha subunit 2, chloroplastic-like [Quercus lobata]|uniref:anthranilate synthase alpha subunit 2, chloroplastic-like n=1 Tax=Quercus lobata TaxID=97700 RepID=UPI001244F0EC|nr:anthranilate synthase alpha subunit 2, chloroplastic-like [Quercus lobata]
MVEVKARELIGQLEVTRRGPYSGGFGGISFSGDVDIALALRTCVGAGIVADSDLADEQKECENKAAALVRAIDLVESSFVEK